jgi:hypothetical protein
MEANEVDGGMQAARDIVEKLRREVWPPAPVHGGAQVGDRSRWKKIHQVFKKKQRIHQVGYIFSRIYMEFSPERHTRVPSHCGVHLWKT